MKFAELDDAAKECAREVIRNTQCQDDWWDCIYDDAETCGQLMGITIDDRNYKTVGGKSRHELAINFSLSYSQDYGCCFSGSLIYAKLDGAVARMQAHAPKDEELLRLAQLAQNIHDEFEGAKARHRILDEDVGELDFSSITITGSERSYSTKVSADFGGDLEDMCNELVSDFAGWIFEQLTKEYEHQTSDEVIEQLVEEYDFDEEGRL